jgi:outer membrane lipoprotein-sorting protein
MQPDAIYGKAALALSRGGPREGCMKKGLMWSVGVFVLLLGVAVSRPAYARTLSDVMASVEKGTTALKTVTGTQTIKFVLGNDTMVAENTFTAKAPDKFRAETAIQIPGQKKAQKVLTVCDGKYIWQQIFPPEEAKIIKMDLASAPGMAAQYQKKFMQTGYGVVGVDNLLNMVGADYDIKVTGTTKLVGQDQDMDVLEGALLKKNPAKPAYKNAVAGWNLPIPAKIRYLIGVNGFIYETQGFDNEGKVMLDITYKNLKFNPGVSDKKFVFKLPKGVPVFEATEVLPSLVK